MKSQNTKGAVSMAGWGSVLILAVVLIFLFRRSFLPDYVHFSNDGPLGQQNTGSAHLPEAFFGTWQDNNDIGNGGGAWSLGLAALFRWAVGPLGYAKFLAPFALFILGLGAWSLFRQLKLTPLAATLATLAAALNSTFFATACWGVAPQEIAIGMDFFALALIVSVSAETPLIQRLTRLALAGLCVGMNVIEAADIGAIFSLFISAFVVVNAFNQESGQVAAKITKGLGNVALVAVFAGYIASQTVVSLIGTQIQGVAGASQDTETKAQHWDWATQWSLPKVETLGLFMPGLFGYKMDTPNYMDPDFQGYYIGGNYWGAMGRDAAWDRYFAAGSQGAPPPGYMRQTGGENYAGVLVVFIAIWGIIQSLRRQSTAFSIVQRRYIWFWTAVVVLSILFAWGRFSIFYGLLYKLPYFSTIRSPTKFIIVFSWAIVILFAYGVDGLSRLYLTNNGAKTLPPILQLKTWWATASGFERKWAYGCVAALVVSLLGWLIFAGEEATFINYLGTVQFPTSDDNPLGKIIAEFAIHQAGWFVLLFAVAAGLCLLIMSGVLGGRRGAFGGFLLVVFLLVDMGRADLPYIIHWDYKQKYDIDAEHPGQSTNPILNFLRDKYYEHRVTQLPFPGPPGTEAFGNVYTIEWMQHQFPYYNIQALDVWQRPRVNSDIAIYENAIYFQYTRETLSRLPREWQLTNTRYIFGPAGFIDVLNSDLDPRLHRFRIVEKFNVVPKPGVTNPTGYDQLTAVPDDNGIYALFEFTGALPRAKLYGNWQVNTNDNATLQTLGDLNFDPEQTVLIDTPQPGLPAVATNDNTGTVEYKSYAPTKIVLATTSASPGVLLLNDKYDPIWQVTVDGQPAPVLRCNYIMRGVYLPAGAHTLVFVYHVPSRLIYVTVSAISLGVLLLGFLLVSGRKEPHKNE